MRHVREQLALALEIGDEPRVLERRTGHCGEGAEQLEVPARERRSDAARIDVEQAELVVGELDRRAKHRAQAKIEDALLRAELVAPDDVGHRDRLAGVEHAPRDALRDAQRRSWLGAAHRRNARLSGGLAQQDEAALGAGQHQRLIEHFLEQGGLVAVPGEVLGRARQRIDLRDRAALQRIQLALDRFHLAEVGRGPQAFELRPRAPQRRAGVEEIPGVEIEEALDAVEAGELELRAGAFQDGACPLGELTRSWRIAARPRDQREDTAKVPLLDLVAAAHRQLERGRGLRSGRGRHAPEQLQLAQPAQRLHFLVEGVQLSRALQRLAVQRLGCGQVSLACQGFAQVAADHRLQPRVARGAPDLVERLPQQIARAREVSALPVEVGEIVQRHQLLRDRLRPLAQAFPGLERPVPVAGCVARHAQVVPGDRFLALIAEPAIQLDRGRRLAGGAIVVGEQTVGGAEAGARVRLGQSVAGAARDQHRRPLVRSRALSFAAMPGAGAEQVVESRRHLRVDPLARDAEELPGELLGLGVLPEHRAGAGLDQPHPQRIGACLARARNRGQHRIESALLPERLRQLLPDARRR